MALVSQGFKASVSVVDTSGSISTLRYDLRSLDFVAAQTDLNTIVLTLATITEGVIAQTFVGEQLAEDALVLPADAENAIKASLSLYLAGIGQKRANLKIPAPDESIFTAATGPGYNIVDGNNAAVLDYIALFQTTGGIANISDGETVRDNDPFAGGKRISAASQNP